MFKIKWYDKISKTEGFIHAQEVVGQHRTWSSRRIADVYAFNLRARYSSITFKVVKVEK